MIFWLVFTAAFVVVGFLYVATAIGGMPTLRRRGRANDKES